MRNGEHFVSLTKISINNVILANKARNFIAFVTVGAYFLIRLALETLLRLRRLLRRRVSRNLFFPIFLFPSRQPFCFSYSIMATSRRR